MVMPPMGESIFECTVLNWLVKEGDEVNEDDMIIEVATDKIDTEIGSTFSGTIEKFLVKEGEIAQIGKPICLIKVASTESNVADTAQPQVKELEETISSLTQSLLTDKAEIKSASDKFYSPLVKSIAQEEGISMNELDQLVGSGKDGRVTKDDILAYVEAKKQGRQQEQSAKQTNYIEPVKVVSSGNDEIIEMDRMRKMIAQRMVESKQTAPHVTSFVVSDMTKLSNWRDKIKKDYEKKYHDKFTFTPLLIEAIVKALKDFPMMNIQVDGDKIIKKKDINIGMAVALPNGNLIVPVIKNADQYNLIGLSKKVNDLANRARKNQLVPDELTGGTFTVSNIGSFGNIAGTPIIVQPQVGIMAFGVIRKVAAVIETADGDVIGIRQQMILSHSYDHRVVDGSLGGMFAKRVADYLENFDTNRDLI